jgi:hypothetical protein
MNMLQNCSKFYRIVKTFVHSDYIFLTLLCCIFSACTSTSTNTKPTVVLVPTGHENIPGYAAELGKKQKIGMELLERFSPTGYAVVKRFNELPNEVLTGNTVYQLTDTETFKEAAGATEKDVAIAMDMSIHEATHGLTTLLGHDLAPKNLPVNIRRYGYFINPMKEILVVQTSCFPSRDIAIDIPEALKIFRYEKYINSDYGAKDSDGIYDFLNEFNAYRMGTINNNELFRNYWPQAVSLWTPKILGELFTRNHDNYLSYLEFKYYILTYLIHAKKSHPSVYRDVLANGGFCEAFFHIDKSYSTAVDNGRAALKSFMHSMSGKGFIVKPWTSNHSDRWVIQWPNPKNDLEKHSILVRFRKEQEKEGSLFEKTFAKYEEELDKAEYKEMLNQLTLGRK